MSTRLVLRAAMVLVVVSLRTGQARADEGMWTFDALPMKRIAERYGAAPEPAFIDHLRLGAVRFGGGSGGFVAPGGLVATNHHVGSDCIQKLSKPAHDLMRDGFLARTHAEERRCPGLEIDVLQGIRDVTAEVRAAETMAGDEGARHAARRARTTAIEAQCTQAAGGPPGARCEVVTLHQGGAYHLYRWQRHSDVRLVFAPEGPIAFFGGDPDNFEYPRFDLDVALFRVWQKGAPLRTAHFFPMRTDGPREGELLYIVGNPGRTERGVTMAQLERLRDVVYPQQLAELERMHRVLLDYGARGAEQERQAGSLRFRIENAQKAIGGYLRGLHDPTLMSRKQATEAAERKAWPDLAAAWRAVEASQVQVAELNARFALLEGKRWSLLGSSLFTFARTLTRAAEERARPDGNRLHELREANLPAVEAKLFADVPTYADLEIALLASGLERVRERLGPSDPTVVAVLGGRTPLEVATEAVRGSMLANAVERTRLWRDAKAVQASRDPMLLLARALDPGARAVRKRWEDGVDAPVERNVGLIARARFERTRDLLYPDATGTLRVSFGQLKGYEEAGKRIAPITDLGGLYARADRAGNKAPWNLPGTWQAARGKLGPKVPLNFVTTHDSIGGNSGSPVLDAKGHLVGLLFDSNIHKLANTFAYTDDKARAVSVHSAAILEALSKVYGATALAEELGRAGR